MGGLSVRAEIARTLPNESLVYFGDGKNVPYGPRSHEEITALVDDAVSQLIDNQAKMVVVACNAATGAAIDFLRAKYDVPIIGMEPAVKPAAQSTESGVVGVLATAAALKGELYRATAARFRDQINIIEAVGEGFVEVVERDREDTSEAFETVKRVVEPMIEAGADRIVLGCTHYPFLVPQIKRVIDEWRAKNGAKKVEIVDSGAAIARRVGQLLTEHNLHADTAQKPEYQFFTAADEAYRQRLIEKSKKCEKL
jgi:glutamate racemase